jgi:hypothetical protein
MRLYLKHANGLRKRTDNNGAGKNLTQYLDKIARLYLNIGVICHVSYDPNLVSFVRVTHLS